MTAEIAETHLSLSRRQFLVAGCSAAGGLVLGVPLNSFASETGSRQLGDFIEIKSTGDIVIGTSQPELGQGLRTTLPMLVAEELDVDWSVVSITTMPLGIVRTEEGYTWKYGGQGVGGSTGLTNNWTFMREVGAIARWQLIEAAAKRWGVAPASCSTERGLVLGPSKDQRLPYGDLVADAARPGTPDTVPELKPLTEHRIAGTRRPTVDARTIVTGKARYGLDTDRPGMRYAVIARCPWLNGKPKSFDDTAARRIAGVLDVFPIQGPEAGEPYRILASGIAVVADSSWAALKGREALEIVWDEGPNRTDSSEQFWADNEAMLDSGPGQVVVDDGNFEDALKASNSSVTHRYAVPFVNHAPLEPQNCYAFVEPDRCHITVPTQMPSGASRAAAEVSGIERDRIRVDFPRVGGSFGRRLSNDFVAEAVMISQKTGWPIKLMWTREDDMKHDFFRPAGLHELTAGVDAEGRITAWTQRLASASKYYRRPNMPDEDLWKPELYPDDFPRRIVNNFRLEYFHHPIGIPRGSWRAPAHTANAFVIQSFLDEVAIATNQDPLEFRLQLFGDERLLPYESHGGPDFNPGRLTRLTRFVAERIGYGQNRAPGHGVGIAAHFTFGGYAAHAIEVSVSSGGLLKIERIVAAIDCGYAVNPNAVEQQLQGATVDGLSTALGLEITVKDGQVVQGNFDDYPLARIADFPERFEAHILDYDENPTGAGEIGIPSAAPALTNAIFNATGKRIRRLPIGDQLKS